MKQNKKDRCHKDLIQRILALDLEPGEILDETALSRQYDLSRTPLREVFQRLAGDGYITLAANRGAKVSSMELERMRNFFQAAGMIYASIARLAAENATPQQIADLKDIQGRFAKSIAASDTSRTALLNHELHEQVGVMSANPYLLPSYRRLLIDHTRIGQRFYAPVTANEKARINKASEQHDDLIAAIERRQPARAVEIILEHWELTRTRIEKYVHPDPLSHDIGEQKRTGERHAV